MRHQIDPQIQVIELPGFHYANCNCLLLEDDERCLIETGFHESELEDLRRSPVHLIVNSHGHGDHCGHNNAFPEAKIMMHPEERAVIGSAQGYLREFGFENLVDEAWQGLFVDGMNFRPTRIDEALHDGQAICTGRLRFQVLHMPGHSAGHCCFLFPEQGFVFTSDIEFSEFGPWYGMVRSSVADMLRSLDRLASIGADYYISGHHAPMIRDPDGSRLRAYRNTILERQRRVAELLYAGRSTVEEIAKSLPIYRRLPNPAPIFWAYEQMMVINHLIYLEEQGYAGHEGVRWFPGKTGIGMAQLSI